MITSHFYNKFCWLSRFLLPLFLFILILGNTPSVVAQTQPTLWVNSVLVPWGGNAPLLGVVITGIVGGSATGPITYTFYCNRSDSGTNITAGYVHRAQSNLESYSAPAGICDSVYSHAGFYWAKIIAERGGVVREVRATVNIFDMTPPSIDSFNVQPRFRDTVGSFTINWSVSDENNLSRVEVWRTTDNNGQPDQSNWIQIHTQFASGNTTITGQYIDTPLMGIYWYGIHAFDQSGNMGFEPAPIMVSNGIPAPTVDIQVKPAGSGTYSDGPITIDYNTAVDLQWTSTNATSCTASGGWSGSRNTSGNYTTGSLISTTTFYLFCSGPGGNNSDSVIVNVSAPLPPDLTLSSSQTVITLGQSVTLSWSSSNVNSCNAFDAWSGNKPTSGSEPVSPVQSSTYTLTCTGDGGTISRSIFITVNPPPDTTPPSTPTSLSAAAISTSQINLSWTASTDNVGVTGYRIYRGGTQIATSAATSYQNTGLSPSTTYTYYVVAYDAAGNVSGQSNSASATTQALPCTGTCMTNSCSSYNSCSTGSGTCSSGYCCSGSCTTPPPPCTGNCYTNSCSSYNNCSIASGTCSSGYCCSGTCTTPCTGTCLPNSCYTYDSCSTGSGTCSSGYCCLGTCTTSPVDTDGTPGFIRIENPLLQGDIKGVIDAVAGILKVIAVGIGVLMIIIAGIIIMTSGGDRDKLETGKRIFKWTIVGVAIVMAASFILELIKELIPE